jgi:polyisoprenoid-binding protein YceI
MRFVLAPVACLVLAALVIVPQTRAAGPDSYKIDPVHSTVLVRARHLGVSHAYVRFNDVSGKIVVDEADPSKGGIEVIVKAESVDSAHAKRDEHLRSPDFLNVKQFPVITFKSTSVRKVEEAEFEVVGDLGLHGVTKSIAARLTRVGTGKDPWGGWRTGAEARFTVKRSEFGMTFALEGVGDELDVIVSIEGIRE